MRLPRGLFDWSPAIQLGIMTAHANRIRQLPTEPNEDLIYDHPEPPSWPCFGPIVAIRRRVGRREHHEPSVAGQDAVGLGEDVAIIAGYAEWQGCAREPVESGVRRELCGYSLGGHDGDHVRKAGGRVWNDRCVNHVEAIDTVDSSAVVDDRAYIRGRAHPARPDDVRQ